MGKDKGEGEMPIYWYKAVDGAHCRLCKGRFEVRQGIDDESLTRCPECDAEIMSLFSCPLLWRKVSPSQEEILDRYTVEESDELSLEEGFAEDEVWE
jgi:putative FmdB family regulatory protein